MQLCSRTPLHCAASCNNLKIVRLLVEGGAAIFAKTIGDNETAEDKCSVEDDGLESVHRYLAGVYLFNLLLKTNSQLVCL